MLSNFVKSEYTTLAQNIYRFRVLQQLSQAKLAELSDVSSAYISQIECEHLHKGVTLTAITKIAEGLRVPPCVLLVPEPCPKYLECIGNITTNVSRN